MIQEELIKQCINYCFTFRPLFFNVLDIFRCPTIVPLLCYFECRRLTIIGLANSLRVNLPSLIVPLSLKK